LEVGHVTGRHFASPRPNRVLALDRLESASTASLHVALMTMLDPRQILLFAPWQGWPLWQ
jgi:hypothetical protein